MKDERDLGVVGDIRIKEVKKKKKTKKKTSTSNTPLWIKIFVWSMFVAMLGAFIAPLIYQLILVMTK